MQIVPTGQASTPTLISINSITNSISKNRYVVYYQIPIYQGMFKPIDDLKQLLLNSKVLRFKILDLEKPNDQPIYASSPIQISDQGKVSLNFKFSEGGISFQGQVINKASDSGVVFSFKVSDIQGYANFLKFRQKYRTLQNITRKQTFKLDHRLKVIDGSSIFYFPLQQSDHSSYFFTSRKIGVQLYQIYSVQDWQTVQTIFEDVIDLSGCDSSVKSVINILQKLKISIQIQMIKNTNFSNCQLACFRMLELTPSSDQISVGTDKNAEIITLKPVLNGQFYDYQFGYLNENLKQSDNSIFEHIGKLTKSFPKYPHLINSRLIDLNGAKYLYIKFNSTETAFSSIGKQKVNRIQIPFVYVLQGLNIIQTETHIIKFYVQFTGQVNQSVQQKSADVHRIFQLRLKDIWNLNCVSNNCDEFDIKIIGTGLTYYIHFESAQVQINSFKKQSKQLQLKQQYGELNQNKYFLLTKSEKSNKLRLTKTQTISDFYLLDLFNSSSVTFQISNRVQVLLQGTVNRSKIIGCVAKNYLRVILTSADSINKVILQFDVYEITQKNTSLRTYYSFMYRLEFTDNIPCDSLYYDLQLKRLTDNKKHKVKVMPEISDDGISTLHQFDHGFFESTVDDMQINLTLRKMYYNEQSQIFDNSEVINKKIVVNSSANQMLQKNCLFLVLKEEGFNSIDFDFYDQNIKKRLKLYFEVCMRKTPLLDLDPGKYTIKIPQYLWKLNNLHINKIESLNMQIHLSSRKKKNEKINIFPDSPQEYILPHHNYKDGLAVFINGDIGYEKIIDLIKVRCDVTNKGIGWIDESQWNLAIVNVGANTFYFMIKCQYDSNENQDSDDSQKSKKTQGKKHSERSYSQKIDSLAKTVSNMQSLKLKQFRNKLIQQGRHLTTKYVKRQETIINLTKKIGDLQQKIDKQRQYQRQANEGTNIVKGAGGKKVAANYEKVSKFYRSICQCGQKNPKYNGFCQNCLKQLRKRYQFFIKQYKQKSYQYQRIQFNKFNSKQKYLKVKNKLKHYKDRIKAGQDIEDDNLNDVVKNLQNSDLKRNIEEIKIQIFRTQEQRQKLQQSAKQRLNALEGMIRKQDEQIWNYTTQMQRLNQLLNELEIKIDKREKEEI